MPIRKPFVSINYTHGPCTYIGYNPPEQTPAVPPHDDAREWCRVPIVRADAGTIRYGDRYFAGDTGPWTVWLGPGAPMSEFGMRWIKRFVYVGQDFEAAPR